MPSFWNRLKSATRMLFSTKASRGFGLSTPGGVGAAIWTGRDYKSFVKEGYKGLWIVYRCVRATAENIKQAKIIATRVRKDGSEEVIDLNGNKPENQLAQLLRRPNSFMTMADFLEAWTIYLELSGNTYVEKVRKGAGNSAGGVLEMWALRPDFMNVIPGREDIVSGYTFKVPGVDPIPYRPDEICHWKYIDPENEHVGVSPIESARRIIDNSNAAISWNVRQLQNSAVPSGAFVFPPDIELGPEQIREAQEAITTFTRNGLYGTLILHGGMDWKDMSVSPKDMQFIQMLDANNIAFCAIFGTPPEVIGVVSPKYENYKIARLRFWEEKIIPLLDFFVARMNVEIAPLYGEDIRIRYDVSHVPAMRDVFTEKVDTARKLFEMAVPFNVINSRLELGFDAEKIPWGNDAFLPGNMLPARVIAEIDDTEEDDTEKAIEEEIGVKRTNGNAAGIASILSQIENRKRLLQ